MSGYALGSVQIALFKAIVGFLADKVCFCDRSLSVVCPSSVRQLTFDLNDNSFLNPGPKMVPSWGSIVLHRLIKGKHGKIF